MAYNKSTGKWDVVRGDCLWNIAKSVYGDPYKWTIIADANGISRSTALIYPGQHLKLPGKTPGSSSSSSSKKTTSDKVTGKKVKITWFALDAGTERSMFCTWKYDRDKTDHYTVEWWYTTGQGGWRLGNKGDVTSPKQSSYSAPDNAKKVKIKIKPIAKKHKVKNKEEYYWTNGEWQEKEWDYSNNPPGVLPSPTFEIDVNNKLTVEFNNIPDGSSGGTKINGTHIQVEIWRDDIKWKTLEGAISNRKAKVVLENIDPGHSYKIRSRALRKSGTTIKAYGFYTDFSDSINSTPIAPSNLKLDSIKVTEGQSTVYFIKASWTAEKTARTYMVEYATDIDFFDTDQSKKQQTDESDGSNATLSSIEKGHTYYVRVASINDKGQSKDWSNVEFVTVGSKPQPPTTYSNTTKCVVGEDLNLYWIHNSTDGSLERQAIIHFEITDLAIPEFEPLIKEVTINDSDIPEEDRPKTHTYKINTDDPEWATIGEGYRIKWKVQTCGVGDDASDWSIEREVTIYAKPEISVDLRNNEDISVDEVNNFPFYFIYQAIPASQTPISYYIEVISNDAYETIDDVGKVKNIGVGDKIYQKYYDPQEDPWRFMLEMSPNNIDLENDKDYTMNVTVAMNSGLSATNSKSFKAYFEDLYYNVNADLIYNNETLEMNIHPYCFESEEFDEIPEGEYTEIIDYKVDREIETEYSKEGLLDNWSALEFDGNTYQETTTGKNKFNINGTLVGSGSSPIISELSLTSNANYSGSRGKGILIPLMQSNTQYTISFNIDDIQSSTEVARCVVEMAVYNTSTRSISNLMIKYFGTLGYEQFNYTTPSLGENEVMVIYFSGGWTTVGATVSSSFSNIQIESGSTASPYELYTGGQPAPSSSFSIQIQSITGTQNVVINEKNKFNTLNKSTDDENVTTQIISNNEIEITYDGSSGTYKRSRFIINNLKENTDYKFKANIVNSNSSVTRNWLIIRNSSDTSSIYSARYISGNTVTFDTGENTSVVIGLYAVGEDAVTSNTAIWSDIILAEDVSTYQPYQTPQLVTIDLSNIKLNKIDTYKDYILGTPDNWVLHRNIAEVTYNGTYAINVPSDSGTLKGLVFEISNKKNSAGNGLYFERAKFLSVNTSATRVENTIYENAVNVVALGSTTDDLDTLKTKFNGGKLLYILAEEQTEAITDTNLISQLNDLYYILKNKQILDDIETDKGANTKLYITLDPITENISYLVILDNGEQIIVTPEELEEMGLTPESEGVTERKTYIHTGTEEVIVDSQELEEMGLTPESEGVVSITKYITTNLVDGAILSVYRREYDGSFTEIAKNISNEDNLYVTDPHPSLDYARYRIVAKTSDTGAVSFDDIPAYETHEPAVVIQWADEWSQFQVDNEGTGMVPPAWSGSMLKLPYNISISDNKDKDVTLAKYVGRNHPVSYYGTQLGETSTWNIEIPKEDKETLYGIRRLSTYTGDVYVREPSGLGYWANIEVSYNVKYNSLIVPVTFNIKRVEGGM